MKMRSALNGDKLEVSHEHSLTAKFITESRVRLRTLSLSVRTLCISVPLSNLCQESQYERTCSQQWDCSTEKVG